MTDKILIVDDDPHILEGLRTVLCTSFHLRTALGPDKGLQVLRSSGPYAVVIADLKMPGMNGIEFLTRVREISQRTVRIMLTGYADVDTAIAAVNTGEVFRFHTKPCPTDVIRKTLSDALSRYRAESVFFPGATTVSSIDVVAAQGEVSGGAKGGMPVLSVLTGKEMRVADLIRMDASSKEIAHIMNISPRTVEAHRENIRKKLGLANVKINLQGFLKTIT
ncbi:MAG: response regulator [Desulfomicrobium sp.]